jgi:O-antigen ligase
MSVVKASILMVITMMPWIYSPSSVMSAQVLGWLVSVVATATVIWVLQSKSNLDGLAGIEFGWYPFVVRSIALAWIFAAMANAIVGLLQLTGQLMHTTSLIAQSSEMEVIGQMRQRNQLASLLVLGFVALAMMPRWAYSASTEVRLRAMTGLRSSALGLLMFCLAATGSRTGTLQMLSVVSAAFYIRARLPAGTLRRAGIALILYVIAVLTMPWLAQLIGSSQTGVMGRALTPDNFSRLALWANTLELIAQKPFMGHGWGSLAYAHYSTEFSGARFMEMLDNAHNLPLHLAVELGLPVALAFCGLVMWGIVKGRPWEESRPDRLMAWGILGVIGIHSMLEYPLWYGPFFLTALLCVAILLQDVLQFYKRKLSVAGIKYTQFATKSIAIGLLSCTGFLVFDYHRVSQIYLQPEERSSWYADDALGAAQKSVLFQSHAKFAELVITPLSRASAPRVLELSSELIHWSPEPRVIEKLIESAVMMGLDDVAAFHLKRYRVAYPQAYAQWAARSGLQPSATMRERTPLTSAL